MKSPKPAAATKGRTTYSAPALEKGVNVLELLATEKKGLTVSEIAAGIGLSVSEIFRIIVVMERRGWLRKSDGDKYSVTPQVLSLAFGATPAEELSAIAVAARGRPSVVVTGIRASLANSQAVKENAEQLVDSVTAEDIGKFPDTNIAESLQRISGIQIQRNLSEGSIVAIRGLSEVRTFLGAAAVATCVRTNTE